MGFHSFLKSLLHSSKINFRTSLRCSHQRNHSSNILPTDFTNFKSSNYEYHSFEDQLFRTLSDERGLISITKFFKILRESGLRLNDPRLAESANKFRDLKKTISEIDGREGVMLDSETFKECIKDNLILVRRALTGAFVLPEFNKFTNNIDSIYSDCKTNTDGKVADYIPQLSRFSPDSWGLSLCTIDGQRHSVGDFTDSFCLQSCTKPLAYALVLNDLGESVVHQYVGQEPSGETFNMIKLDHENKPHNPMINAGAIVITSLIQSDLKLPDRFDYVSTQYKRICGGEHLSFNNSVFLSERSTANRNFALGYYLKENKCFPEGVDLMETMDFYFQLCSIDINCESGAVMAATLANGGICPITGDCVLHPESVRSTLSLMHSCGMYDYSGQFAFHVGLPSKSGVSGAILLVIPNVLGMCLWSPPLDRLGNSVRGLEFCKKIIDTFNFHNYDNLLHTEKKIDPRKKYIDKQTNESTNLLFAAFNGDITALRRLLMSGADMQLADYDGRTVLHVASAEGHLDCVRFLLEKAQVSPEPRDRWGRTPLDDATMFGKDEVVALLQKYKQRLNGFTSCGPRTETSKPTE